MKRITIPPPVWILFLAVYTALFVYLFISGTLRLFLHPRMTPFVIIAAGLFFLITLALAASYGKARAKGASGLGIVMFAIPIVLFIAYVTGQTARSGEAPTPSVSKAGENTASRGAPESTPSGPYASSAEDIGQDGESAWESSSPAPSGSEEKTADGNQGDEYLWREFTESATAGIPAEGLIRISDEYYWEIYNELYDHPTAYKGRTLEVSGFMYREEGFPPDTCFVARNIIWCCAADTYAVGFLARSERFIGLAEGNWVRVEGILGAEPWKLPGKEKADIIPSLSCSEVVPIEEPKRPYIFAVN